ncbi:MAG: aldo/keto reductase [Chitinivibrionales bacterium]
MPVKVRNKKKIEHRRLGRSDLHVSPIGLGCWQFSGAKGWIGKLWPLLEYDTMKQIVQLSLEGGVNWFDTAEVYGWGESERNLTSVLKDLNRTPGQQYIATKWWPFLRMADHIRSSINERLEALQGYPIDLYQIHQPFSFSSTGKQMEAMAGLVTSGKIRYVGVSNFSAKKMRKAHGALSRHGIGLVSNQIQYSLLDRDAEKNGVMEAAKELGISIIAYSPLAQGLLTGKFHDDPSLIMHRPGIRKFQHRFRKPGLRESLPVVEVLKKIGVKRGATAAEVALAWTVQFHGETVVAIPGATRPHHVEQNVKAMNLTLTHDELDEIDRAAKHYR